MDSIFTRRAVLALGFAATAGLVTGSGIAQDTHGGSGGHSGAGQGHGGAGSGGGHLPGGGDDTEHGHDEGGHTDTSHGHTEHDPDAGHADGKEGGRRGPRYQGGRAASGQIQRGHGRSLEDRVLKGD